jgi:beta-glucosidase
MRFTKGFGPCLSLLLAPILLSQTPEQRAQDLVSRMSLTEKVSQMQNSAPAIPRLNIPEYDWWNEALHGVAYAGLATVFPQAIGLAATWDPDLMYRTADAISTEARAKFNQAQRDGNRSRFHGLTFWSPNINIFRDPRWGRGQETYGEDPYLTSRMAVAFITGMQGADPNYLKTIATPKHFAVHSGPEPLRHAFDALVNEQDLEDTYLPAFRASIIEAKAVSIMCAYNSINGVPACANAAMLQARLRDQWGFQGYVVSDCTAITDIEVGHAYATTLTQAAADSVTAGTDLSCGSEFSSLAEAVKSGLIPESTIDHALQRLFAARFRLGMFDSPELVPYASIPYSENDSPAHRNLALEAAQKSIVLLKNANHILPLGTAVHRIAVIGPAADERDPLLASYHGIPSKLVTPLDGIHGQFGDQADVRYALGSTYTAISPALVPTQVWTSAGLQAEYFDNPNLAGQPKVSRLEPRIYLNWDMRDPALVPQIPRDEFSVRWTGALLAPYSGDYTIGVARTNCNDCTGTDSALVYLDENSIISDGTARLWPRQTQSTQVRLEAGRSYQLRIEYRQSHGGVGIELVWTPPAVPLLAEARDLIWNSDVGLLFLGLNSDLEGEEMPLDIPGFLGGDRTDITLPQPQQDLLRAALDTGKPIVVILMSGSAIASQDADQSAAAVLEAWYGGEEAGTAIAQILAGDVNPAGRLPVTFYRSIDQLPPFEDYAMSGRTYRYFQGSPLYGFGYGLSYSTFHYSDLQIGQSGRLSVSARVTNTSSREGDEVAQLYIDRDLKGFQRIHLSAGQSRVVQFTLTRDEVAALGCYRISVGGGQPVSGNQFVESVRLSPRCVGRFR